MSTGSVPDQDQWREGGEKCQKLKNIPPITPPGQSDLFRYEFMKCELTGELRVGQVDPCQVHKAADFRRQCSWQWRKGLGEDVRNRRNFLGHHAWACDVLGCITEILSSLDLDQTRRTFYFGALQVEIR